MDSVEGLRECRAPVHLQGRRAPIACIPCRKRKTRCTSGWPSCRGCIIRSTECRYPGVPHAHSAIEPVVSSRISPNLHQRETEDVLDISASELQAAAEFFYDNFGSTLLFFFDPLSFSSQFCSKELPLALTLSILAITTRFSRRNTVEESLYYHRRAEALFQNACDEISIHVVQTSLVLCVYEVGCGHEHRAWLRLGNAIRTAQILGLPIMDKPHTQFDWGRPHQCVEEDMMTREIQRRTFWSCFFVDKLLSNGRDRPSAIHEEDVFCHNPISEEDFIFRRFHQNSSSNKVGISHEQETNLYVFLIRIICILGEIMTWHGRGGRFSDKCAPWNMDMPFTVLDQKLDTWKAQIPDHLKYSSDTFTALSILSSSQAKVWGLMYLFFFLAKTYLHREYLPFIPTKHWAPFEGPYGLASIPQDWGDPPLDWWKGSVQEIQRSSRSMTELYGILIKSFSTFPGSYPFVGLCLITSASVHALLATIDEEEDVGFSQTAQKLLQDDIKAMEKLKRFWDLATHWVNQIEFYRAILKSSRTSNEESSGKGHNSLADGIMNYIRQSRVIKEDRVQTAIVHPVHPVEQRADSDPSVVFQPKFVEPSKRRGPASTRSPTNLYSAASHHAFRDLVPSGESTGQAQNQNDIDWTGLPIDGGQASGLTTFLPMLDENLENQVASLANWDYVQF